MGLYTANLISKFLAFIIRQVGYFLEKVYNTQMKPAMLNTHPHPDRSIWQLYIDIQQGILVALGC